MSTRRARGVAVEEPAQPARRGGFLRVLLSDYKAAASLVGLLVYGVVRVAYDAFYARLGVFPEAVGLSETTILGRAVLYLALTLAVTAIVFGLWFFVVDRSFSSTDAGSRTVRIRRPLAATPLLAAAAAGVVAASSRVRAHLGADHLAYYCVQRCKFSGLKPSEVKGIGDLVRNGADTHPGYRFIDFGPEWLVAIPLLLLVGIALLDLLLGRRLRVQRSPRRGKALFALLAFAAFMVGLLAPHLVAASKEESQPAVLRGVVFVLVLAAVLAGLLEALAPLVGGEPRRSPWLIASFVVVVPVLLGFLERDVPLYIEEEGLVPLLGAAALLLALVGLAFLLWPDRYERTVVVDALRALLVAVVVASTLYLAWERGRNLAKKAAMGDQILVRGFSVLSVRSGVVCLEPAEKGATLDLPKHPFVYLGETGGTLVLYDYVADLAHEVPEAFPVRAPASGVVVRVAHFGNPKHPIDWANWGCAPNS